MLSTHISSVKKVQAATFCPPNFSTHDAASCSLLDGFTFPRARAVEGGVSCLRRILTRCYLSMLYKIHCVYCTQKIGQQHSLLQKMNERKLYSFLYTYAVCPTTGTFLERWTAGKREDVQTESGWTMLLSGAEQICRNWATQHGTGTTDRRWWSRLWMSTGTEHITNDDDDDDDNDIDCTCSPYHRPRLPSRRRLSETHWRVETSPDELSQHRQTDRRNWNWNITNRHRHTRSHNRAQTSISQMWEKLSQMLTRCRIFFYLLLFDFLIYRLISICQRLREF